MHPPKFLRTHLLSQWPECSLEIGCRRCETRTMTIAVKGLMRWYGNRSFADILDRLRCKYRRRRATTVRLHAARADEVAPNALTSWCLQIISETVP
jgi:hypothetical protein